MPKNIILCSDGTGNSAVKGRGTNVFKLFESVDLNGHRIDPHLDAQLAFYDDGVGTEGNAVLRAFGGAAGIGLSRNVRQLYKELARVYDPGDRIYLFGFSRGAFTVRTLGGLIGTCGVLHAEHDDIRDAATLDAAIEHAYSAYRAKYSTVLTRAVGRLRRSPNAQRAVEHFHESWPVHRSVRVRFIGVWDTVDAVGMPFALSALFNEWIVRYKFPAQSLGAYVDSACHALALDDARQSFEPVLWQVADGDSRIEQVWFAGAHANVGGGYPKQGMSLVALDWMLTKAHEAGLRLQPLDLELFRGHASVDDMLYNSRAGMAAFYRWTPRDVTAYCRRSNTAPAIHLSVAERIAHGTADYAPGNIPADATVVFTPTGVPDQDRLLRQRAEAVGQSIRHAHLERDGRHLLDDVPGAIAQGVASYWTLLAGWALTLSVAIAWFAGGPYRALAAAALVALAVAWWLGQRADRKMRDAFSVFWHRHRPAMRAALKRVKAEARAETVARSQQSVG
jgi:uncharacterized protein (DUF2235 family)